MDKDWVSKIGGIIIDDKKYFIIVVPSQDLNNISFCVMDENWDAVPNAVLEVKVSDLETVDSNVAIQNYREQLINKVKEAIK